MSTVVINGKTYIGDHIKVENGSVYINGAKVGLKFVDKDKDADEPKEKKTNFSGRMCMEKARSMAIDSFNKGYSGHYRLTCQECKKVIRQCRCPGPKSEQYGICELCDVPVVKAQEEASVAEKKSSASGPKEISVQYINRDEDFKVMMLMGSITLTHGRPDSKKWKGIAFKDKEMAQKVANAILKATE